MSGIKIVEYNPSYAESIAEMWNKSVGSWGGSNVIRTEQSVLHEHENSSNLNVFLAVENDEVIGYCSFSKYFADEGALYIPLLNVRPDYHGKKVGRALVTKAVEKTNELGWPRLDLFTWPGNTKAVPVYKKCGFFWEKRDDSTHLMNFIPTVLQTEALMDYFRNMHWYADSKRIVEIKPDGRNESGFTFYEYVWEKEGRKLKVEFEKTGRGMCLIETDDYLIRARVQDHELVFGRSYKVFYDIKNKSGKKLSVTINGADDRNISFKMDKSETVNESTTIEGEFHIGEILEEQNTWRTHPAVISDISINGRKACFKTGIMPKFPANIVFHVPWVECYRNSEMECFIEMQNNFKEEAVFEFQLPDSGNIRFDKNRHSIKLSPGERNLVEFKCRIEDFEFYSADIPVKAVLSSGEQVSFCRKVSFMFKGSAGSCAGSDENAWYISNGAFISRLYKNNNVIQLSCYTKDNHRTRLGYPKIGMPFSSEFSMKKPDTVEHYSDGDNIVQKAVYTSEDFSGIRLESISKLSQNGVFEHYYTIVNCSGEQTADEISLSEALYHDLFRAVIPYEGGYREINDPDEARLSLWSSDRITENWIFSRGSRISRGLCWSKDSRIKFGNHEMYFEHNFGRLAPHETVRSKSIFVCYGTFTDWQAFRGFALSLPQLEKLPLAESLEMKVNGGNPFINGKLDVKLIEHKNTYFNGTITLASRENAFERQLKHISLQDNAAECSFEAFPAGDCEKDVIGIEVDLDSQAFLKEAAVFMLKNDPVKTGVQRDKDYDLLYIDNGVICAKAAPSFSGSLISLACRGSEWLDTSFPNAGPRSWWNPWVGGIGTKPWEMTNITIMNEERKGDFTHLTDCLGNSWEGIRLAVKVTENEKFKGLKYNQYFLLLPGVPVMCHTVEIIQETGSYFNFTGFGTECFLKPGGDIRNCWFTSRNRNDENVKYKSGSAEYGIAADYSLLYGYTGGEQKLQVYANLDETYLQGFTNRHVTAAFISNEISAKNNTKLFTKPVFFIFGNEHIDDSLLKSFNNIKFGRE